MKIEIIWYVNSASAVKYRHLGGAYCHHLWGLNPDALWFNVALSIYLKSCLASFFLLLLLKAKMLLISSAFCNLVLECCLSYFWTFWLFFHNVILGISVTTLILRLVLSTFPSCWRFRLIPANFIDQKCYPLSFRKTRSKRIFLLPFPISGLEAVQVTHSTFNSVASAFYVEG
jgi:hypothetical protein